MYDTIVHALAVIVVIVVVLAIVDRFAKRSFLSWTRKPLLLIIATVVVLVLTVTWNDFRVVRTKDFSKSGPMQKIFRPAGQTPTGQYR